MKSDSKNVSKFFLLVFILTLPIYMLIFLESQKADFSPENAFPFLILTAIVPILSALIFSKDKKKLLKLAFDFKKITNKKITLIAIVLLPVICFVIFSILKIAGHSNLAFGFPVVSLPILFLVFFIMAIGEELGWMGYAFDPMRKRFGLFKATFILGLIWAIWHIPFYIFIMKDLLWVLLLPLCLFFLRFILIGLHNSSGKSVFIAILFHAMYNLSVGFFPVFLVPLGVILTCIILLITAIVVFNSIRD